MPLYFFDFHDESGVTIDDIGVELPNLDAARAEARKTIGEEGRELMARSGDGQIVVEVRDKSGPRLRVAATFVTTACTD